MSSDLFCPLCLGIFIRNRVNNWETDECYIYLWIAERSQVGKVILQEWRKRNFKHIHRPKLCRLPIFIASSEFYLATKCSWHKLWAHVRVHSHYYILGNKCHVYVYQTTHTQSGFHTCKQCLLHQHTCPAVSHSVSDILFPFTDNDAAKRDRRVKFNIRSGVSPTMQNSSLLVLLHALSTQRCKLKQLYTHLRIYRRL